MVKLTLAISTLDRNLTNAISVFTDLSVRSCNLELIIICQNDEGLNHCDIKFGIKIYYLSSKGLSKSRNYALLKSQGKYIWFLDDDVILKDRFISNFLCEKHNDYQLILSRIYCSDLNCSYKNYNKERVARHKMLQVSSIEIIVDRDFVIANNLFFNEELGLGSKYPSGEENVFLLNLYDCNINILETKEYSILHPCTEDKRNPKILWSKPGYARSKYIIASTLGGLFGFGYLIKTCLVALFSGVNLFYILKIFKS